MTPERAAAWILWGDDAQQAAAGEHLASADEAFRSACRDTLAAWRGDPDAAADHWIERALARGPGRPEAEALLARMGPAAVRRLVDRLAPTDPPVATFAPAARGASPATPSEAEPNSVHLALQLYALPAGDLDRLLPRAAPAGEGMSLTTLDPQEATTLSLAIRAKADAVALAAPDVTVRSGETATVRIPRPVSYVARFRARGQGSATVADPVVAVLDTGLTFDLQPTLSSDRRHVTVEVALNVRAARRPFAREEVRLEGVETPLEIERPEVVEEDARATFRVPVGTTVLLRGPAAGDDARERVLLLTPRLVPAAAPPAEALAGAPLLVDLRTWTLEADRTLLRRVLGRVPGEGTRVLPLQASEAEALLGPEREGAAGVTILESARLSTLDGRPAEATNLSQLSYVSDYDVRREGGRTTASPVVQTIRSGTILQFTPTVAEDWTRIDLAAHVTWADVGRPIPEFEAHVEGLDHKVAIQIPEVRVQRLKERVDLVPGDYVLLGPFGEGPDAVGLVLVHATITAR